MSTTRKDRLSRKATDPRGFGFTASMVAVIVAFLLTVNLVLGFALIRQSSATLKGLINQRMLDVVNTAAGMLDGDEFEVLTADDQDTEAYQQTRQTLNVYLENIDLEYIYGIRQIDEDTFVFTIDPDPVRPGLFGEPVVTTDALRKAAKGVPAVDDVPYEDSWGRFYSAYSPVFNSKGEVSGIVAVDFSAQWYNDQIAAYVRTTVGIGVFSLVIGALVMVVATSRLRRKFRFLHHEVSELAEDLECLTEEVAATSSSSGEYAPDDTGEGERHRRRGDEIDALSDKIRQMQLELRSHIRRVQEQAYTDGLTGVGNKAIYVEGIKRLDEAIASGEACFSVAVFDINGLKEANDTCGHDEGDKLIIDTARTMCQTFGSSKVYRIGGDEFFVILEGVAAEEMAALFEQFDVELAELNLREDRQLLPLSISKGSATYDSAIDNDYPNVFKRADEEMYRDKAAYYRKHGVRRGHYQL